MDNSARTPAKPESHSLAPDQPNRRQRRAERSKKKGRAMKPPGLTKVVAHPGTHALPGRGNRR